MNNQKWFLILPIIKNQVLLTSLCHPLCAEKYQDDLRNNSCDLLTPEIHDEVNGCCQTNPDILPLRHFQLSRFPHPTVTQISSTGGALQTSAWFSQQCNKTGLLSLWRYSAEWRKGMGRVRYGGRESGWETESFHLWPTEIITKHKLTHITTPTYCHSPDRRCLSYKKKKQKNWRPLADCWNSAEKSLQELLPWRIWTKNHLRSHQAMGCRSHSSCSQMWQKSDKKSV